MENPVFLPLMREPQPDTTERKRLEVQAIEFALPEKCRMEYVGPPVVFRFDEGEQKCP
jgi:hypothetical protein